MGQNNRGSVQDLILLVSLFVLAVVFLANIIVGSIFSVPYKDPTEGPEEILRIRDNVTGKIIFSELCNEDFVSVNESCICSVQFVASKWGFLMHGFLYLGITATAAYLIANVFRMSRDGRLYCSPAIFSMTVSISTNVTFLFFLAWILLWDNELWTGSTLVLFFALISSWVSVVLFSIHLSTHTAYLHHNSPVDLWVNRILVQNVLAMTSQWILCLLLMNFAMALNYNGEVEEPTASVIMIVLLNFILAIWTPLEVMLFDKVFRYMLAPYAVLVWTLASIYDRLVKDKCTDTTIEVYALVLLVTASVVFLLRVTYAVYRHIKKPLARSQ